MGALNNEQVSTYLNDHFDSTFQKVGSFRIVDGAKQGGNVASYFCTADQGVLSAVAGPVDAATMLREARWVVETRKAAVLNARGNLTRYKQYWRLAHAERLQNEYGFTGVDWQRMPLYSPTAAALGSFLDQATAARSLDKQGQVHLLLAVYPLAPLDQAYRAVYEKIVGEKISSEPVADRPGVALPSVSSGGWSSASVAPRPGTSSVPLMPAAPLPGDGEDPRERQLRQARDNPTRALVATGDVLNLLLDDVRTQQDRGTEAPSVALDAEALRRVNLAPGDPAAASNFGLLRDGGKLSWPAAWDTGPLADATAAVRRSLEASLREAVGQARTGAVKPALRDALRRDFDRLRGELTGRVDDVEAARYIEARSYLRKLDDALKGLERADAGRYLNDGLDPAQLKTVADLVKYMTERDLRFGPARPGDEWAYLAVQRALAAVGRAGAPQVSGRF